MVNSKLSDSVASAMKRVFVFLISALGVVHLAIFLFRCRSPATLSGSRGAALRGTVWFGLFQLETLTHKSLAAAEIAFAIEQDLAINKGCIHARINAQRMSTPNGNVRVLAGFDRADATVNSELKRRVPGNQFQGFYFTQVAVAHRLGSLNVQTASALIRVGVHRDYNSGARHDRGVVGNSVVSLDLVRPVISKDGSAGAVLGNLFRNLVSFERVLKIGRAHV